MALLVKSDKMKDVVAALRARRGEPPSIDHWHVNPEGKVQEGLATSPNTFHNGIFHQMFTSHLPPDAEETHDNLKRAQEMAVMQNHPHTNLMNAAMAHMLVHFKDKVTFPDQQAADPFTETPEESNARRAPHVHEMGKWLDSVRELAKQHGLDQSQSFKESYRGARMQHARYAIDHTGYRPQIPVNDKGVPDIPKFASREELNDWASQHMPHITHDMDYQPFLTHHHVFTNIAHLGALHSSEALAKLRHLGIETNHNGNRMEWKKDAMAQTYHTGETMGFSPKWFGEGGHGVFGVQDEIKKGHRIGFFTTDHPSHVVAHEFGHAIHSTMHQDDKWRPIIDEWEKAHVPETPISKYSEDDARQGRDRPYERFAEGFAKYALTAPQNHDEYTQSLGKLVRYLQDHHDYDGKGLPFTDLVQLGLHKSSGSILRSTAQEEQDKAAGKGPKPRTWHVQDDDDFGFGKK